MDGNRNLNHHKIIRLIINSKSCGYEQNVRQLVQVEMAKYAKPFRSVGHKSRGYKAIQKLV